MWHSGALITSNDGGVGERYRNGRQKKILIVDDEADFVASLAELLEEEGYLVETAQDGREALAKLGPSGPDVVILDLMMPVMGGAEVLSAMKADPRLASIPVILSTSDPSPAVTGAFFMRKPINIDRMLQAVQRLTR